MNHFFKGNHNEKKQSYWQPFWRQVHLLLITSKLSPPLDQLHLKSKMSRKKRLQPTLSPANSIETLPFLIPVSLSDNF